MSTKKTILYSFMILIMGAIVVFLIFMTEPKAEREGATKETAMLVEVTEVEKGDFFPVFEVTGTVKPAKDIILSPRVSGEVIDISDRFMPGGFFRKGEVILQIDTADYKNILELRKSELMSAQSDLKIEMGRQKVAEKDYQLFDGELAEEEMSLILRQPQLEAIKAKVKAAQADLDQAELELKRTTLKAPFDLHVISRNVNIGSQVSPGEDLGRLVGINNYWIITTIDLLKVRWLEFPEKEYEKGSEVIFRNRTAWKEGEFRSGYLFRLIGALEGKTRLAKVIVNVPDPLLLSDTSDLPRLIVDEFVQVKITGREIKNVFRVKRDFIRENNTIWIMKSGKLDIRKPEVLLKDAKYAYITEGLEDKEKIVITNLSSVTQGAKLRLGNDSKNK